MPMRHELRQVARARSRWTAGACRSGARVHVADADAEDAHAVLVGIEAAERLAEHLGHAVAAVGLRVHAVVDGLVAAIEADRVIAGGEDEPRHAVPPRGLEDVVAADDVGPEDARPRSLHRVAAQVHDRVDPPADAQAVGELRDVGADECFAGSQILHRPQVGQAQRVLPRQRAAEPEPHAARGPGDEDGLHGMPCMSIAG